MSIDESTYTEREKLIHLQGYERGAKAAFLKAAEGSSCGRAQDDNIEVKQALPNRANSPHLEITGQPVELCGVFQAHKDDCVSACVAMLLGYALADIPRFDAIEWHEQLCDWLNARGYGLVNILFTGEQKDGIPSGYTIGAISSQIRDGWKHCVVCLDGMIVWDPKTGKQDGTKRAEEYTIIYPLNFTAIKREYSAEVSNDGFEAACLSIREALGKYAVAHHIVYKALQAYEEAKHRRRGSE